MQNKMFDEHSVELTLGEFRFHIAGLVFIALNRIIGPAFYAQKNSKLPTLAGIISFGANILLVLAFTKPFGGNGIACAGAQLRRDGTHGAGVSGGGGPGRPG